MCSKDTKQNVPESCGYNLTKRGICPCGTWLSFSCFNNPRETLADTLIQKLLQLLLSQPPSQVSKGRTKLLSHTCKELYSTDGSCGIRGCGRRGTSEGEKKKNWSDTPSRQSRINSEAEVAVPPWKLGATDSPHQQLIHWGSEEFLVRDYSWLQRKLFKAAKKKSSGSEWKETNHIPKGGSAYQDTWSGLW